MGCQDRHATAVAKEKPKNQLLVVIGKATVCMKQKQAWYLQMDNNLKTRMLPQSMAYAVCILSGIRLWSSQTGAPGTAGMWSRGWGVPELGQFHLGIHLLEEAASCSKLCSTAALNTG